MSDLIFLRIYKGTKLLEVKQFQEGQIVIGREGDVTLKLSDVSVSPVHCVIEKRESGYFVCDMGSATGTFKNGLKVLDEELNSGDEIIVGQFKVEFHIGIPKPVTAPSGATAHTARPAMPSKPPPAEEIQTKVTRPKKSIELPTEPSLTVEPFVPMGEGTFAPPSENTDLNKVIKPATGNIVEIVVAWKERILTTYHFEKPGKVVTVGSHPKNDIIMPLFTDSRLSYPLVKLGNPTTVYLTNEMGGEIRVGESVQKIHDLMIQNRLRKEGAGFAVDLLQNGVIRVDLLNGVSFYIRYVQNTAKPIIAPLLNLSSSELTTLVLTSAFFGMFWIYLMLYTPPKPEEKPEDESKIRKATFVYKKIEHIEPVETTENQKAKGQTIIDKEIAKSRIEEGKAAEAKPNKSKSEVKKLTTDTPGAGKGISKAHVNTGKQDSGAKSEKKDVTKSGLLSVFGTKGMQDSLEKTYSGSGVVSGLSKNASGTGGQSAAGAGDEPGLGMKDIGKGGEGTATVGIAGVKTQGRGGGREGYGSGGLGGKKNATIIAGGEGEEFLGNIDRDAIRRVINENRRQFQACYERVLNKRPDLFGKVSLQWDIDNDGRAQNVRVKGTTLNNAEVEQCMVNRLRALKFPDSPLGKLAAVTYPFVFNSK